MANDITDAANFSFNNMKPDADEEVTALWGQNLADNTGALWFQNYLACSFSNDFFMPPARNEWGTWREGTLSFIKQPNASTLNGTFRGNVRSEGFYGGTARLYVDGTQYAQGTFGVAYSNGIEAWGTGFSVDISGFTNYQHYEVSWSFDQNHTNAPSEEKYYNLSCSLWGTNT